MTQKNPVTVGMLVNVTVYFLLQRMFEGTLFYFECLGQTPQVFHFKLFFILSFEDTNAALCINLFKLLLLLNYDMCLFFLNGC